MLAKHAHDTKKKDELKVQGRSSCNFRLHAPFLLFRKGRFYTVKEGQGFLSPAGISLTKLSLTGNIEIIPGQGEFG
jgi:hypothetical protein